MSSAVSPSVRSSASCVAANEFASGTGCPASWQVIFGISPLICPYFVMTMPRPMRLPSSSDAARAICHAALPTATSTMRPVPNVCPRRAFSTAASGKIAANDSCMMPSASLRRFIIIAPFLLSFYYITRFKRRLFLLSICMSPVIIDIERTSLAASFQNRRLFTRNNRTFGRWGGYFFWVIASKYPVATTSNTIASNSVILTHPLSGERSRHKSGDVPRLL